ncbi:MAG: MotA/TolQ/ExbB proton channel family protein [Shewanella sp.]
MKIMAITESFLVNVVHLCYYPVKIGLVIMVLYVVFIAGQLLRESIQRKHNEAAMITTFKNQLTPLIKQTPPHYLDLELAELLQQNERMAYRHIERLRFIVRAAPGIGLMGTLIPMGMALASLAQGDMPEMAGMMVNAFNSAIVGLGTGVVAFALALVKDSWIQQDSAEVRYLAERASLDLNTHECHQSRHITEDIARMEQPA